MRLRWITVLCALALKLALIAAMLLLGRWVLNKNYAVLEREHVEDDLRHVCLLLQTQLKELNLTAMDYAQWDRTYRYMQHRDRSYETDDISPTDFRAREIALYLLIDRRGNVVLVQSYDKNRGPTLTADVDQLRRAARRRSSPEAVVSGLMTLTRGPAMVTIRPVLTTRGSGPSRGTLILARDLGPIQTAQLSRLSDIPVTISGTFAESSEAKSNSIHPALFSIAPLDENRLQAATILNDIWQQPSIRLQVEHERAIWQHGKQTIRILLLALIVAGMVFVGANVWLIQHMVVRRVEQLIQLTRDIETDAGLSARVEVSGNDELSHLGRKMNEMLQHLQNSQDKLLAVQERLRYEATHDSLTGIWNRATALQLLDRELDRSAREGSAVAVIMFDADHFKRINDHFGHSIGDRALQAIAAVITRGLRSFDTCCRYGGEEFLVIAPNCNLENAEHLASRILDSLRKSPIMVPDHSFCVTMSAGVSSGQAPVKAEDLVILADRALYRAKDRGRDCVESEVSATGKPAAGGRFAPDQVGRAG